MTLAALPAVVARTSNTSQLAELIVVDGLCPQIAELKAGALHELLPICQATSAFGPPATRKLVHLMPC